MSYLTSFLTLDDWARHVYWRDLEKSWLFYTSLRSLTGNLVKIVQREDRKKPSLTLPSPLFTSFCFYFLKLEEWEMNLYKKTFFSSFSKFVFIVTSVTVIKLRHCKNCLSVIKTRDSGARLLGLSLVSAT